MPFRSLEAMNLEDNEVSLTDAQRDELDHRLIEYERNPDRVIPWEQVRAALFNKQ
jgi:putative addiction module component (TIGR02574 family)